MTVATILGGIFASITIVLSLPDAITAFLVAGVLIVVIGTRQSGMWLTPFGTAFFILTLNLLDVVDIEQIRQTTWQRIADNLIGALIALLFGLLIPILVKKYRKA